MVYSVPRKPSSKPTLLSPRGQWPEEELLDAIRLWADFYEEPPLMIDWDPARARRSGQAWRAERFESGRWPTARMITRRFGTFGRAISLAGFEPRRAPARLKPNLRGDESVLDAIRAWARRYGDVPTLADWDPARARRLGQEWRVTRYYHGDWPSTRTVFARFGSMRAAIRAAGLIPREIGERSTARRPERHTAIPSALATAGPDALPTLAEAVREVARARRGHDPEALHTALIDVAAAATAWARSADAEPAAMEGFA